jgi:pimeloyl-ACP methyl ester carboxylesterase
MLELICSSLNYFSRTITMASFAHKVIRSVFGAAEHVAPRLTGRVAFEIFCRTANPNAPSPGERKAIDQAARFMADARRHCLPLKSGRVTAFDFRQPAGAPRAGTVLVIHGWHSRTEYMRRIVEGFRNAGHRVIALDLPGHGHSSGRRLNMMLAVDAARAAGEWFGPFKAVVGHSFGGAVAVNAAVGSVEGIAPLATERLVLIAAPSSMPSLFEDFGRMLNLGPRSQTAVNDQVERVAGRPLSHYVGSEQLALTPIPTLVIHAPDDREVSADSARMFAAAGDHVRLHWAQGLGHRRILADAAVVTEAVRFVAEQKEPELVH